jgi:hypothetical protein
VIGAVTVTVVGLALSLVLPRPAAPSR